MLWCERLDLDGQVGLVSARGSDGLHRTTVVSPAQQQATLVWDSIDNDSESDDNGVLVLMTLSPSFWGAVW